MSGAVAYALVNESHAAELTPAALEQMREDLQAAFDKIFAVAWAVLPASIFVASTLPGDVRVLHLVDTIPEAPDALAYHTIDAQGRPVLRLGVETIRSQGGALLDQISIAASHEIFETAINPFIGGYEDAGKPVLLAREVCDPVQGGSFQVGSTAISNFVLPTYFDASDADGPYDYMGQLSAPFSCAPDGYQAWSDGTQTFGERVPPQKRLDVIRGGRLAARAKAAA